MSIHLNEMPSIFTTPIPEKLGHLVKYKKKNQESVKCYFSLMIIIQQKKSPKRKMSNVFTLYFVYNVYVLVQKSCPKVFAVCCCHQNLNLFIFTKCN